MRPTTRQFEVLRTLAALLIENRLPPTYGEVAQRLHCTKARVAQHVYALQRKGWLARNMMKVRAIVPTQEGWDWLGGRAVFAAAVRSTATGTVEEPIRCDLCGRELYGAAIIDHVCAAEDLKVAS